MHATDPHIFLPAASDPADKDAKAAGEKQQESNEKAFADLLSHSRSVPDGDGPPAFLVLTGDLGVDPCPIATGTATSASKIKKPAAQTKAPPKSAKKPDSGEPGRTGKACVANVDEAERRKQIQKLATVLGSSPFKDIYLVAGNNDIASEDPGWSQHEYLAFWETMLRTRIRSAWFNRNWQFSNGCVFEFAVAQDAGLPTYDYAGQALDREAGIALVKNAIEQMESDGLDTKALRENLARLW